ncbi:hypothetical protein F5J12DRAFT_864180 [Pisolithus orientalis]|uniref:uncharacterized protein n=1 Tax=Pisolithus orientalis TaxID=936130 RepID=UPI002224D334|nr:uncharacterized protein F5J12DRAFT_864180 [Pisolithus orientalis]KAI5989652.1 hypothetical protein F5J12DRAFT_864180 [Pisolithus orientalis]
MNLKLLSIITLSSTPVAMAGPLAYAACQTGEPLRRHQHEPCTSLLPLDMFPVTGCNMIAVGCYSVAGFTFGTVAAAVAPPMILACNAAQGTCMAACAATALWAPIP